ncbi:MULTISPECIES: MBL fold metallo-hydrolase RNA specificity domain-containing protein [Bordetella]|uniref:MBL fold metallo-hydrolase n=1 Tax=Bordetella parapertussis (strain Bpp5) TaxID=1208660 RepID=K0MFN1_BORPB|nr:MULTISPECIES: MBL fold metallo-hydrolase [Bordetella]KDB65220.1 beta-Casp domain protein [Bordetella bronchiseptica A1-7]KDB69019.1 beta-Casp domain protein [Bordetella bronchiseptica B20-10725633]KDC45689.1 beta-Casp domain protein [Bordetella bronchiseptica M85/00/2]KDC56615.1 beta-Casp domain protein [Bordetella bronchiseptica MBORD595]KDC78475.1 beta-Casp domain protein [Bordetella bronchiseptica MBORD632]
MLTLTCLGGAGTVTGSKHLLRHGDTRLLVDCGLFQGLKNLRELNWQPLPVAPADVDAVVLTHAHLDHCGYLPRLVAEGFRGRIHATPATRDVAELILLDSANLQEKDAEFANRKGYSRHAPALPLYRVVDAERALARFSDVALHRETALPGGATLTLRRAGHILGAATAQIDIGGMRVVFSGDLGRYNDPVMHDPEDVRNADYLVIESTYGNRRHDAADPVEALGAVIERTVLRGGTVVIPAFAVGRAQTLIHALWKLRQAGRLHNVPVYLDSPMATSATELLARHASEHKLSAQDCEAACAAVTYVRDVEGSKALSANRYPKVIISASGMATGGRVLHHMAAFGADHRNTLLFAGFQAAGTRGRKLLDGATETRIYGQWMPVRAEVAELPMLSAHADSDELMRWLAGFQEAPRRVFIVHGEPQASQALRERIQRELNWQAIVPVQDRRYTL